MWWVTTCSLPVRAPIGINFMPSWWYREYGIAYGERIFADPEYRARTQREMNRLAHERFGDVGLGTPDPPLVYGSDDLNNATMPAVLGCEVVYPEDQYAANLPLTEEQVEQLQVPEDITQVYPMCEIIRQARWVAEKQGQEVAPFWATMGIQNIAVRARSSAFFLDYYARPELADKLLSACLQIMLDSLDFFLTAGSDPGLFWNQNCTVPLVGPQTYEERLLPYERRLQQESAARGQEFAIHHCGDFDTYAPLYRRAGPVAMLDIGWGSDLRLALDTFPEARVSYIIGYQHVRDATPGEVRDSMRELLDTAGPDVDRISFNVADLEHGTPDENIRALVEGLLN